MKHDIGHMACELLARKPELRQQPIGSLIGQAEEKIEERMPVVASEFLLATIGSQTSERAMRLTKSTF